MSLSVSATPPPASAKTKPAIPPKPWFDGADASPPQEEEEPPAGKVKKIVDSLSQAAANGGGGGTPPPPEPKAPKKAPTVKPKPRCKLATAREEEEEEEAAAAEAEVEQAPPLPEKRSRRLQPANAIRLKGAPPAGEEALGVEGGRSAPDGKEVELQPPGGGGAEAEHCRDRPPAPTCAPTCGCVCHLQRPGMRLVWVPALEPPHQGAREGADQVDGAGLEDEGEEVEEEEDEDVQEEERQEEDRVGGGPSEEEAAGERIRMALFHHTLNAVISDTHRRRSDPGLNSLCKQPPRSPPVPTKRTHSSLAQLGPPPGKKGTEVEEESIYECRLVVPHTTPPPTCRELDIPLIRVRKPQRRSKLSSSLSDPTSEFQEEPESVPSDGGGGGGGVEEEEDEAPPIPERMPMAPRTGLPAAPAPPRPLSPSRPPAAAAAAAASEQTTPKRALPTPPLRMDPRRLSSASSVSASSIKEQENGCAEIDEDEKQQEEEDDEEEERPVAPPRRGSSYKWSRLQDEPLYQTYRATVITKEIRRQTIARNISKTSADFPADWQARRAGTAPPTVGPAPSFPGGGGGGGPARLSPMPGPGNSSTLWQDLPQVRDSGLLDSLTPEECKYQESMFEVLTSETSYLRSLRVLTDHFLESRELTETLLIRDKKTLFSNILKVREVSERFLKNLEDRMNEDLVFMDICDIIHYHAQHDFPVYIDYVRNQIYQEKIYSELMKNSSQFAEVITRLQESPQCQRLPFMSFLLLPFQRITRIKMLIENILKRTKEQTKEEQTASKALDSVSKIIKECNTEVGKMKQVEELILLSRVLEFDKLKALPIISQNRYLEKKGELGEMSKGGTIFNMRAKFTPVHLFLFNDLLILAAKKGPERFVVVDHAHRSLVQVEPVEEGANGPGPYEHCFTLTLLENHQGRLMERLLKATSQSDMHRWVMAFPNPGNPEGDVEEVIYEDWDCPQVQCVEQYVAQQTDELSLEPTEIINVLRKTNEGWYEGSRLSDGQKGWFPVASVVEITNEHVRRRNLRERYRVMQAAAQVAANSKARAAP